MTNQNLIDDERQKKIKELTSFHKELKSYKRLLDPNRQLSEAQKRYKESLREKLVRKSGALKEIIIKLTGWEYADGPLTGRFEIWGEAFNETPLSANEHALAFCIDAVNEAIGKLQSMPLAELEAQEAKSVISESPFKLFDAMQFHPKVVKVSKSLFKNRHYAEAIFAAFKAVNNFVKEKTGLSLDGKNLMAKVFREENPIIRLNKLKTKSEKDEQEGFMFLFMGAMVGIRNPKAHDNVIQADPYRTLEYLALASLLMRRIDEGKLVKISSPRKQWNLQRFLNDIESRCSQEEINMIKEIYNFTKENADKISWGTGVSYGSFTFRKLGHGILVSVFTIYSDGDIGLNFGEMKGKEVKEEVLQSFRANLNEIPGINIPEEAIRLGKFPSMTAETLTEAENLRNFQDAVLALCQQIESGNDKQNDQTI